MNDVERRMNEVIERFVFEDKRKAYNPHRNRRDGARSKVDKHERLLPGGGIHLADRPHTKTKRPYGSLDYDER